MDCNLKRGDQILIFSVPIFLTQIATEWPFKFPVFHLTQHLFLHYREDQNKRNVTFLFIYSKPDLSVSEWLAICWQLTDQLLDSAF